MVLRYGETVKELSGHADATTNNQMELTACIEGLRALKQSCQVILFTDSEYVRRGILEWMDRWTARGWITNDGKPVKNKDLWLALKDAAEKHLVRWEWVRGHNGDAGNERANELARSAIYRVGVRADLS